MSNPSVLRPAVELAQEVSKPFPGDSDQYRRARVALLAEEIELRRQIERVAEQRRALPPGGAASDRYRFTSEDGRTVAMPALFATHATLVVYLWMAGPERTKPCPMCSAFLDALDLPARHITQRVALAVVGRAPIERQLEWKRDRGWRNLKFYASHGDDFATDYRGLAPDGSEWPALMVFHREGDRVHLFWAAELGGTEDPGQDARGAPDPTPLWNILDLTPEGRGAQWYPRLED